MRTSKFLLGTLAVVTGLLVGFGSAKEVKAALTPLPVDDSGVCDANSLLNEGQYCLTKDTTLKLNGANKTIQSIMYNNTQDEFTLTVEGEGSLKLQQMLLAQGRFVLNGGDVTIENSDGTALSSRCGLTVNKGTLSAKSTSDSDSHSAIVVDMGDITVNGGTVKAEAKKGMGIYTKNISITSGSVNVMGGKGGIYSIGKITIDKAKVTVTGTGQNGYGIYALSSVGISNGAKVYAEGQNDRGVITKTLSVMEGRLEAKGNVAALTAENSIILNDADKSIVEPEGGLRGNSSFFIGGQPVILKTILKSNRMDVADHVIIDNKTTEKYNVTVECDKSKGTAKADPASEVEEGKTVKLTAAAGEGYEFDKWTSEDGVQFKDASSASTEFEMPGKNVTVTATFKKKGEPTPPEPTPPGPSPEPSKKVVINSKEDLTLDEKFGMEYSLCDENGKNFKNVKISKFEISGDIPDGLEIVQATNDNGDCYQIKGTPTKAGTYKFTVTITFTSDEYPDGAEVVDNITIKVSEKRDRKHHVGPHHDDGDHEDNTPAAVVNPNSITCYYIVNGVIDPKALFGKQEQGPACKASFTASCPKGWTEAFSFSMSYEGANTTTLKNGTLQLYIPGQYQKAGRQYAVMAMDKYGVVHIYQDTDALPFVFTAPLNFEGYAFNLIYKD